MIDAEGWAGKDMVDVPIVQKLTSKVSAQGEIQCILTHFFVPSFPLCLVLYVRFL